MELITGAAVTGEDLHGRDEKIQELWSRIKNSSILLVAPRRFGKTNLIREMMENPKDHYKVIYLDMEGTVFPEDFVVDLIDKAGTRIWEKIKEEFKVLKDRTQEIEIHNIRIKLKPELKDNWKDKCKKIFEHIQDDNVNVIIALDEFPTFLENLDVEMKDEGKSIKLFLQWLRSIRQTYGIKFILCDSIGFDTTLTKYNLTNTINDVEKIDVPPFTKNVTKDMIEKLLDRYELKYDSSNVERILDQIGTVPFFIQLLIANILSTINYEKISITNEIIDNAYSKMLSGPEGQKDFRWYWDRLKNELKDKEYGVVLAILDELSAKGETDDESIEEIFKLNMQKDDRPILMELIRKLEYGFYIAQENKKYCFTTKVFCVQWKKHVGIS